MPSKKYTAKKREEMRASKQKRSKLNILKPFLIIIFIVVVIVAAIYAGLSFLGDISTIEPDVNNIPSLREDYGVFNLNSTENLIDVLLNDEDKDGDILNIVDVSTPSNGIAEIYQNKIMYTPDINFTGVETFNYKVSDGEKNAYSTVNVVVADKNPIALMDTSKGMIILELYNDKVPITANNFINLSKSGFYDETKFHRISPDFMIQGGDPYSKDNDPSNDGQGGPGYTIKDEFHPDLKNERGMISMANSGPDTGGSQFFILVTDAPWLDNAHAVFGKVIYGINVVDIIANAEHGGEFEPSPGGGIPKEDIIVNSITIENESWGDEEWAIK